MNMKTIVALGLILYCFLSPENVRASDESVFALIITNNRSYSHARPDLQYADDDGARYYSFFRMVADEKNLTLLTKFDEPSRRLYPDLDRIAKRPRRSHLKNAIQSIKHRVDADNKENKKTIFYFVFAGHGHIDKGKGYLELEDGRLGPDDLEKEILEQVKADVVHVVLDSCNSFFVINPRKPGGKRWATPKDMTRGFSKRYPHVGVVLSTNSASEVYEWSEIGSGIFSHEIRSGMSGAADANEDRKISYDEIDAFVATANLGIKNEAYMPKVYVRGPWNKGSTSLLDLRRARGRRIQLGSDRRRLWIRDEQGVRLVDLCKETEMSLSLVLPGNSEKSLYIQEQTVDANGRPVLNQYVTPRDSSSDVLSFDALNKGEMSIAARGHDEVFQMLFVHPFGPRAFDAHLLKRRNEPEIVFGISDSDKLRMRHYLGALSRVDRQKRYLLGGLGVAFGLVLGAAGTIALLEKEKSLDEYLFGGISLAASATFLGFGTYQLLSQSRGEATYETFVSEVDRKSRRQAESIVAKTELYLGEMQRRERMKRFWTASIMYLVGTASIGAGVFLFAEPELTVEDKESKLTFGTLSCAMGLVAIGLGITRHFIETPVERMLRLYKEDPDLNIALSIGPVPGGAATGVSIFF